MKNIKPFLIICLLSTFFFSCDNNEKSIPENNEISISDDNTLENEYDSPENNKISITGTWLFKKRYIGGEDITYKLNSCSFQDCIVFTDELYAAAMYFDFGFKYEPKCEALEAFENPVPYTFLNNIVTYSVPMNGDTVVKEYEVTTLTETTLIREWKDDSNTIVKEEYKRKMLPTPNQ
jgi:hypothetical protein